MPILLSACAGVPRLQSGNPHGGPTVEAVVGRLSCELQAVTNAQRTLPDGKTGTLASSEYAITVAMKMQVDDTLGGTPFFSYTEGLKPPSTSLVSVFGADFNGQRKRTFVTTFTVNSGDLSRDDLAARGIDCADAGKNALYRLDGSLGLEEIVANGLSAQRHAPGIVYTNDKTLPSFGSEVQFIVTQAITAVGPTWTLRYWKGPSGSNGLFNAKRLDTNSIIVTFAPKARTAAGKAVAEATIARDRALAKEAAKTREIAELQARLSLFSTDKSAVMAQLNQALGELAEARDEARKATTVVEAAEAKAKAADGSAESASRDLLNTMLLQSLNGR